MRDGATNFSAFEKNLFVLTQKGNLKKASMKQIFYETNLLYNKQNVELALSKLVEI